MTKEEIQLYAVKSAIASARLESREIGPELEAEILEALQDPSLVEEKIKNWVDAMKQIQT